ncbi:MAG: bile acid:sodium symporter family protein [Atopobiaceae bacterium]|jgi:predicted Na+-dependent transporter|nr:bile acid:sodium symporter family protein [Atopobiaceae bacterium]MCH4230395.1 bile acid:sodium symporter family protein [Atopobiaceae bacterium]MCI1259628.1 bile acid:sodium symporter family protein [Atopobiaceae bacterium]
MAFIAPFCVAAGVLFPDVFGGLETVVPALFAFMTFQGSLNNTFRQVVDTFRHPAQLLVILGVTSVAMPVVARLLAGLLFGNDMSLVTGIVLEYSIPVAVVSFMWVGMFGGNTALGLSCVLVSTVIAPLTIPAMLQLLLGESVQIDTVGMMVDMLFMIALPALAGMLVNDLTHGWGSKRLSPAISPACKVLLMIIITANSTEISDYMRNLTPELVAVALFCLVFASCGFLVGLVIARAWHLSLPTTVTMCFDCGLRNISSGAVIAAAYFPGEAMFPVMMGTLFQQILAATFGQGMQRVVAEDRARTDAMVERGLSASGHDDD